MIHHVTVENIKRIVAADIDLDGHVVKVSGLNGAGKTSLTDAIALALTGGDAAKLSPVALRDGEDEGHVTIELDAGEHGPLEVTRRWRRRDDGTVRSSLTVGNGQGASFQSPQKLLDGLLGDLTFDPLAFTRLGPRDQVRMFLSLADPDFDPDESDRRYQHHYAERRAVGREVRDLNAQIEAAPHHPDAPADTVDPADVLEQINEAQRVARANQEVRDRYTTAEGAAQQAHERLADIEARLEQARRDVQMADTARSMAAQAVEALEAEPDVAVFTDRLAEIEQINDRVRENAARAELVARVTSAREAHGDHEKALTDILERRAEAVRKADLGVPGLGMDADGLTLNGLPFVQASAAEQLRVAMAVALRMSNGLRLVRILDGSLLDDESMAIVEQMAEDADAQVLVEIVTPDAVGVHIEDGRVV